MSSMPIQKPGRSKQDYGTPWDLIRALEHRFGPFAVDLAASKGNAKAPRFIPQEDDSFKSDWAQFDGNLWLNPPFSDIAPWARRCAEYGSPQQRVFLLTPASVGSNWFEDHVFGKALVLFLKPRLTFEGASDPYPKDLIVSVFGEFPGFHIFDWQRELVDMREQQDSIRKAA